MSKKRRVWAVGLSLSAVLDWCKRTAGRYRRFAGRIPDQLRMVGRENPFEVARVRNGIHTLHVDWDGRRVEFSEFIKVLSIGDRIRVFCDDGLVVAEKISETRFKLIHTETTAELVHRLEVESWPQATFQ